MSVFEYDPMDRLVEKTTVAGVVAYEYDLSGMKTEVTDPNLEAVQSAYDAAGRLIRTTVLGSPNRESYYHYDDAGLIARKVLSGDRVLSYYSYDVAGRLTELVNRDDADAVLTSFAYQRNENGAITRIAHEGGEFTYYAYDALDRLTEERRVQNPTIYGFAYEYDAASNRTRKEDLVTSDVTVYTHDARNLIQSEVTGADETLYEYDQAQRMTLRASPEQATYFSHDQRDLPTRLEFAVASGTPDSTREFRYTGTGERAALVGELGAGYQTYLAYDGSRVLTERDQFFTYGKYRWGSPQHGGGLVESEDQESGTFEGPVMDERGSVDKLVGASGRVVYDRFGVELANNLASTTRTRFVSPAFLSLGTSGLQLSLTPCGLLIPVSACGTGRILFDLPPVFPPGGPDDQPAGLLDILRAACGSGPYKRKLGVPAPQPERPEDTNMPPVVVTGGRVEPRPEDLPIPPVEPIPDPPKFPPPPSRPVVSAPPTVQTQSCQRTVTFDRYSSDMVITDPEMSILGAFDLPFGTTLFGDLNAAPVWAEAYWLSVKWAPVVRRRFRDEVCKSLSCVAPCICVVTLLSERADVKVHQLSFSAFYVDKQISLNGVLQDLHPGRKTFDPLLGTTIVGRNTPVIYGTVQWVFRGSGSCV